MARELTEAEIELALEYAIKGVSLAKTAKALGFSNDMAFHKYCLNHPVFDKDLRAARLAACLHLEDKILDIPDNHEDPKMGRVQLQCYETVMRFRDPSKYGQRVDINLTQTVDIGSSLARMQSRLAATYAPAAIDVTPAIEKPKEIKDLL